MCGIVGIYSQKNQNVSEDLLRKMADIIAYRGPDDEGYYIDGSLGLGHRRLSVIDLSNAGHQPMVNEKADVVISYNGEIYNFKEIRSELESTGTHFNSQTDTEVVLESYIKWGEACVNRFNGMFAFSIYDRSNKKLFLARDRYGVKPLYWMFKDGLFVFGSEVKSILQHPQISAQVDPHALIEYFSFQNIFSNHTLFRDIQLLPPGHTLALDLSKKESPVLQQYWDFPLVSSANQVSEEENQNTLFDLFQKAVTRQLVSDVEVGAYLSGGMDSGSIVAVARKNLGRLFTFTGGFDLSSASGLELGCDERRRSEIMANLFKTEHYEMVMHAGDMEHVMPDLVWHLEDLRVGQSYPNYYVSRLASKFVKVVISGAGGDELFGGYPWRYYRGFGSSDQGDYHMRYYQFWQRLIPDEDKPNFFNREISNEVKNYPTFDVFRGVFKNWKGDYNTNEDFIQASLYFELKTFLHGLLVVEDKLSMSHSLETRVPFLDNDLVDFAMKLPAHLKLKNLDNPTPMDENIAGKRIQYQNQTNEGKIILRNTMSRLIPPEITESVKQGFSAPDASWFRGESIDYIRDLLLAPNAKIYSFLNRAYITNVIDQHCSGKVNYRLLIWSLLCFEWWCRKFLP